MTPLLAAVFANRIGSVAIQLAVGTWLTPTEVSVWALVVSWMTMLMPFQASDFARLPLQFQGRQRDAEIVQRRELLLATLGTLLLAVTLGAVFTQAPVSMLAALGGVSFLRVIANQQLTRVSAEPSGEPLLAKATLGEGISRSVCLVLLALAGAGAWSFPCAEAAAVASLVISTRKSKWRTPAVAASAASLRALRTESLVKMGAVLKTVIASCVESSLSMFLVSAIYPAAMAGNYFFALRFGNQLQIVFQPIIGCHVFPKLIAASHSTDSLNRLTRDSLKRVGAAAFSAALLIAVCGPFALRWMWGERWADAAAVMPPIAMIFAARVLVSVARARMEAVGRFDLQFRLVLLDLAGSASVLLAARQLGLSLVTLAWLLLCHTAALLLYGIWQSLHSGRASAPATADPAAIYPEMDL